jgi:hypothetical protein
MPLFRVTMDDRPDIYYEGNSPTSPWNLIVKRVLELRTENPRALSVSGPEYYGLASPIICYLIQQMEGADQCVNYVMRPFAPPGVKKPPPPRPVKPPVRATAPEDIDKPKPMAPATPPPLAPLGTKVPWMQAEVIKSIQEIQPGQPLTEQQQMCLQHLQRVRQLAQAGGQAALGQFPAAPKP